MQISYDHSPTPEQYEPNVIAEDIRVRIRQGDLDIAGVREGVAQVDLSGDPSVLSSDQMAHIFGAGTYRVPALLSQVGRGEYGDSRAIVVRENDDREPDIFITDLARAFDNRMQSRDPFDSTSSQQLIRGQLATSLGKAPDARRDSEAQLLLTQADDRLLLQITNARGRRDSTDGHPTLSVITKAQVREAQQSAPSPKGKRLARVLGAVGLARR